MKLKFLLALLLLSPLLSEAQTKGHIVRSTGSFYLQANIRQDHKFFGYARPSVSSEKLILFSVFTKDVKDNPYKCTLGAYYQTLDMKEGDSIEYVSTVGNFYKMKFIPSTGEPVFFYFQKRFIKFE